jgi:hypothetical protein
LRRKGGNALGDPDGRVGHALEGETIDVDGD